MLKGYWRKLEKQKYVSFVNALLLVFRMLVVGVWFALLIILLVLLYFYRRDRKARKAIVKETVKPSTEKRDSDKSYTIVVKEDGSVQVMFGDGEAGARLPSGKAVASNYRGTGKAFADKNRMVGFLGGAITQDLPEMIPDEKGTYVLILHVWKNRVTPIEASSAASYKNCGSCGALNDSDAGYCKKCGRQLK
jgi:ribosomal protein L40E